MYRRAPVVVTDIATDPLWEESRELALDHGLRACASSPILDGEGAVLGTFAFYYRTPRAPSTLDLRLIAISSDLAGIAIERARRVSRLEEAISARDTFLAIASHELRTPITTLLFQTGALRLLWRDAEGAIPLDELAPKLALLERQSARLSRLVGELLDVSRLVSGQLDLVCEPLDLTEVAREVVAKLQGFGEATSTVGFVGEEPVTVVGDRSRLEQVITNLLSNAMKFGASRPIEVRVEASANVARLVVRDQGVGIAKENLERVFQKFERIVSVRNHGGFGLGLWLCRQMVERMNGRISIESEARRGGHRHRRAAECLMSKLVHIVDDDRDLAASLADALQVFGYGAECFAGGLEALERLRRGPRPCVILLDLMMPGMNGWEVCDAITGAPSSAPFHHRDDGGVEPRGPDALRGAGGAEQALRARGARTSPPVRVSRAPGARARQWATGRQRTGR